VFFKLHKWSPYYTSCTQIRRFDSGACNNHSDDDDADYNVSGGRDPERKPVQRRVAVCILACRLGDLAVYGIDRVAACIIHTGPTGIVDRILSLTDHAMLRVFQVTRPGAALP